MERDLSEILRSVMAHSHALVHMEGVLAAAARASVSSDKEAGALALSALAAAAAAHPANLTDLGTALLHMRRDLRLLLSALNGEETARHQTQLQATIQCDANRTPLRLLLARQSTLCWARPAPHLFRGSSFRGPFAHCVLRHRGGGLFMCAPPWLLECDAGTAAELEEVRAVTGQKELVEGLLGGDLEVDYETGQIALGQGALGEGSGGGPSRGPNASSSSSSEALEWGFAATALSPEVLAAQMAADPAVLHLDVQLLQDMVVSDRATPRVAMTHACCHTLPLLSTRCCAWRRRWAASRPRCWTCRTRWGTFWGACWWARRVPTS
jgi:hypothetical protein